MLPYDESNIHPLIVPGAPGVPEPGNADVNINLVPGLADHHYTINGVAFVNPPLPVLLQILHGARGPSQLLPSGSVYELPRGKVIELSVPATELTEGGALGGPVSVHHTSSTPLIRVSLNSMLFTFTA